MHAGLKLDPFAAVRAARTYLAAVFDASERLRIGRGGRGDIYIYIYIYIYICDTHLREVVRDGEQPADISVYIYTDIQIYIKT